ncbi:GntR family transcriptional regulator [Nonomuraea sp. NPDC050783]|uniref:GntR family transcriptional regulator n=1 Tax=Nonomuraea sp. NPDC050783 TaxID=3154634 RepID=UPI0034659C27
MNEGDVRPRYVRIADQLRARITSGELAEGDRLPSIPELVREHGIASNTAQRALGILVTEGLAEARSGSGTYVRARPAVRRLIRSWNRNARGGSPFAADMANQGQSGSWDYDSRTAFAPEEVRRRLALGEATGDDPDVIRTHYVFRADGRPVMLSTAWEPLELTRGTPVVLPEDGPHAGKGVVERMRQIGVQVTHAAEVVSARNATVDEAGRLDIRPPAIVLTIERTYYADGRPVETADIVIPVDRYQVLYGTSIWDEAAAEEPAERPSRR